MIEIHLGCIFIKSKIHWCNGIYKKFQNSSRSAAEQDILQHAIAEVSEIIYKKNMITTIFLQKVSDSTTGFKTYGSILKFFYNGKKVPLIPPFLIEN